MRGHRSSFARRQLRRAFREFVRANRGGIAVVCGIWLALLALFQVLADGYVLGLMHGLGLAAFVALVGLSFLLVSGTAFQLSGAWGEDNTRDVLRLARRRGHIFGWVDNLEVANGDVDHLVVAESGVYVLDSKWHSHGIATSTVDRDVASAHASVKRASSILRSLKISIPVIPMVVVWGGDQAALAGVTKVKDGVRFVAGRDLQRLLGSLPPSDRQVDRPMAESMLTSLRAFKRRVNVVDR